MTFSATTIYYVVFVLQSFGLRYIISYTWNFQHFSHGLDDLFRRFCERMARSSFQDWVSRNLFLSAPIVLFICLTATAWPHHFIWWKRQIWRLMQMRNFASQIVRHGTPESSRMLLRTGIDDSIWFHAKSDYGMICLKCVCMQVCNQFSEKSWNESREL